ncbi:MAG TPA: hypothetical protein VLZ77_08115, partial [Acidimicrobiales bacterium]|nr:hypothetical protein [Acidimicrobiales bacterium]
TRRATAPPHGRHPRRRAALLAVLFLAVLGAAVLLPARPTGELGAVPASAGAPHAAAARLPVTATNTGSGTLPPADPSHNIAPSPNFLTSCSGNAYDDSPACVSAALQAIANARQQEGLPGMVLPSDWTSLTPEQQVYVSTNLERTVRGLPPLSAMASALDQSSQSAAAHDSDPSPPAGFPWTSWGGNWAGAMGNPLEADYFWMYDDGMGSANLDCTPSDTAGCWGHRNNILIGLNCRPCLMGTGFNATAWSGSPSWTELLVDTSGSPQLDFSWAQVTPDLSGSTAATPPGSGLSAPVVGIAATPDGQGYWLASRDGGVFAFGDAGYDGSMGGRRLGAPIVGIAATPDGGGYWLVASDGGIFAFGDAGFAGSVGGHRLDRPVVGMAATADGRGYWEVASDGGIFAFGDAGFRGSMGGHRLDRPVVGMAATRDGRGYWEVASDGGIFAFGDAPYYGSTGGTALFRPVVSMSATADGDGYWMTASDGGIFSFGDASFRGSTGGHVLAAPVVSITAPSDTGYWLAAADGGIFSFGVPFHGSMG